MVKIAVSGHMDLTPRASKLIEQAVRAALAGYEGTQLVGVSCLAPGADSIFADAVLERGGQLHVIIPAADYRQLQARQGNTEHFDALVAAAAWATTLPFTTSGPVAYQAANEQLLASCDRLIAIWDGDAPVDDGSTAAVVSRARHSGIPVEVIWPAGAARSST